MAARGATIRASVASAAVLLAGLRAAPHVPLGSLLVLSVVWYGALAVLVWSALRVLSSWIGRGGALLLVGVLALLPILLTAIRPAPELAVRLPCPRNWTWLPAWLPRSSPLGSLRFELGRAQIKLCYGRPASRGRRMLGGSRVPFGRLWRTGANEPTTLITTAPLEVAGIAVPRGRTALYSIPGPESWELILNRSTGQWGLESEYSAEVRSHELGRTVVASEAGAPVERLIFRVSPDTRGDPDSYDLLLAWEMTRVHIPLRAALR